MHTTHANACVSIDYNIFVPWMKSVGISQPYYYRTSIGKVPTLHI